MTRISTGIQGLDQILHGGFIPSRVYLAHGEPGTGKTTLGFHFLTSGKADPASNILITFDQPEEHLRADARTLGMNIDGVSIVDLTPAPEIFSAMQTYDIFSPAEIEREPITLEIAQAIGQGNARRIVVDGFDHFRQLATDTFHYRRLIQSFFRFATRGGATVLIGSEGQDCIADADGVIHLELGLEGRSLRILKFRGSDFHPGYHPMRLSGQGIQVLPNAA
jgi:circadian clock protein KaiC